MPEEKPIEQVAENSLKTDHTVYISNTNKPRIMKYESHAILILYQSVSLPLFMFRFLCLRLFLKTKKKKKPERDE